jgi:hypothetical protein
LSWRHNTYGVQRRFCCPQAITLSEWPKTADDAVTERVLIVSGKLKQLNKGLGRSRGQGVIEYAGALIIAAVLVSMAIFVVPENISSLLNDIMTAAVEYFISTLPS